MSRRAARSSSSSRSLLVACLPDDPIWRRAMMRVTAGEERVRYQGHPSRTGVLIY